MRVLTSTYRRLYQLAYSWDGTSLYATSDDDGWDDQGVDRWELGGESQAKAVPGGLARATDFAALPDGHLVVCSHRPTTHEVACMPFVLVVDPSGAKPPWEFPATYFPIAIVVSPLDDRLLVRGHHYQSRGYFPKHHDHLLSYRLPLRQPAVAEWDVTVRPLPDGWTAGVWSYQFDPTGKRVLSIETTSYLRGADARVARWRSATTGKSLGKPIPLTGGYVVSPRLAANGTRLIEYHKGTISSLELYNPTAKVTKRVKGSRKHFTDLAVHPDGKRVFASNNDGAVREYDAVTLQELRAYDWKIGKLTCIAVAPDGATAAAGSDTGKVVVWDLE